MPATATGAFGSGAFDLKRKIDPGDVFTGNANITTQIGKLVLLGSFAYMSEWHGRRSTASRAGRQGARYVSNLTATYPIDDRWALALNGSWSFQEKNEIVVPGGGLVTEPKNSNSNVLIGSIEPSYLVSERLRLAVNYSFLWRDENFYDQHRGPVHPGEDQAHGRRVGDNMRCRRRRASSCAVRYSWIDQDTGAFVPVTAGSARHWRVLPPGLKYDSLDGVYLGQFRASNAGTSRIMRNSRLIVTGFAAVARLFAICRLTPPAQDRRPRRRRPKSQATAGTEMPARVRWLVHKSRHGGSGAAARGHRFVGAGVLFRHAGGNHRRQLHSLRAVVPR